MKPLGFYLIPRMFFKLIKDLFVFLGMIVVCLAMVVLAPIVLAVFLCKVLSVGILKLFNFLLRFTVRLTKRLNGLLNEFLLFEL